MEAALKIFNLETFVEKVPHQINKLCIYQHWSLSQTARGFALHSDKVTKTVIGNSISMDVSVQIKDWIQETMIGFQDIH